MKFSREILHNRHRLSHQQIDMWLGENRSKEFLQEKMRQLVKVKNFINLGDLLHQNGIPFVNLKGPLLSYRIYNDATVRLSNDIDILIDEEMIDSTIKILFENQFEFSHGTIWPQKKSYQKHILRYFHHLTFFNKELNMSLEVHWKLLNNLPVSDDKLKNMIKNNLIKMDFSGRKWTVLNPEFDLFFLMIHGANHKWERLKWLVDVSDYLTLDVNFLVFENLVKEFKAERILDQTNFFLEQFFNKKLPCSANTKLPKSFINFTIKSIENEMALKFSVKEYAYRYYYGIQMFPDISYKFGIISRALYRSWSVVRLKLSSE
jgi:hypothetical protein